MDRSARFGAAAGRTAGPIDAPCSHPGNERGKLSAEEQQEEERVKPAIAEPRQTRRLEWDARRLGRPAPAFGGGSRLRRSARRCTRGVMMHAANVYRSMQVGKILNESTYAETREEPPSWFLARSVDYSVHTNVDPTLREPVQSGPKPVAGFGTEIIAFGPAFCSPLKGVGLVVSNPHAAASSGLLNQKPTWKVWVGARAAAGSKPNIWSSRMVLMATSAFPLLSACTSV